MFPFRLWCLFFLIIGPPVAASIAENANDSVKFSHVYPVIYSNLTEFLSQNVTVFPKHPEIVEIEYLQNAHIKLNWIIDRDSLASLQGFGIQVICNYGSIPDPVNLTVVPRDKTETDFDFVLDVGYGSSEIVLYSLPYQSECFSTIRKTVVMFIRNVQDEFPSTWMAPIFVFSQQNNVLSMNFTEAPDNYNIVEYKICMWNKNISRCSTVKKSAVKFENIPDSSLNFSVIPFNRSINIEKRCCSDENNCTACGVKEISYTSQVFCVTPKRKDRLYSILGGFFIGFFLIIILILTVKLNRLKSHNLEKKLVLLIHTSDNEIQAKAVENFIACLESIDIVVLRPTLPTCYEELQWLLSSFDNIILLDSLALGQRQEAWAVGKDYRTFLLEDNSKEVTKNLFNVINMCHDPKKDKQFLRCKWDFVPKELEFKNYPSNSPIYILPNNLQVLAEAIHGVSVDASAFKSPKKSLKENILREAEFIVKNPSWFQEKYGMPVCTENEVETPYQPLLYPVLHGSDLVSRVSSQLHQINERTDNALQLNQISLSAVEVMSV